MKQVIPMLLSLAFLVGCIHRPSTTLPTSDPTDVSRPNVIAVHTSTPQSGQEMEGVFDNLNLTPTAHIKECPALGEIADLNKITNSGVVVTMSQNGPGFWNLRSNSKIEELIQEDGSTFNGLNESPDRKWLSIIEHTKDNSDILWLFSNEESVINKIPLDPKWFQVGWLDSEHLLFDGWQITPGMSIVINPFIGDVQELRPSLHNIADPNRGELDNYWGGLVSYSPDQSTVVYYEYDRDNFQEYIVVYNLEDSIIVWKQQKDYFGFSQPLWSPDGKIVAIQNNYQLFLISTDGVIKTNKDLKSPIENRIGPTYSWSPDGRLLAIWILPVQDQHVFRLIIVDIRDESVIDSCIQYPGIGRIIWSPDSKFLISSVLDINHRRLPFGLAQVVLSLENNTAYPLPEDQFPYGWLTSP